MRPPLLVVLLVVSSATVVGGAVLASDTLEEHLTGSAPRTSAAASSGPTPGDGARGDGGDKAPVEHTFPVAGCHVSYAATHHDYPAADVFADRGCRFVAPVDGYVDEVERRDTWDPTTNRGGARGGLSVSVVGDDGVRYYGSHLESVAPGIGPGVVVEAGQTLGRIGDSGSARGTGTHLHFGISWPTPAGRWWIRRGAVPPQPYLDAWREGRDRSPAQEVARAERRYGDDSGCRAYC